MQIQPKFYEHPLGGGITITSEHYDPDTRTMRVTLTSFGEARDYTWTDETPIPDTGRLPLGRIPGPDRWALADLGGTLPQDERELSQVLAIIGAHRGSVIETAMRVRGGSDVFHANGSDLPPAVMDLARSLYTEWYSMYSPIRYMRIIAEYAGGMGDIATHIDWEAPFTDDELASQPVDLSSYILARRARLAAKAARESAETTVPRHEMASRVGDPVW